MDADEKQILELYGAYFFVIDFVPRAWFEAQEQPIELARSEDQSVVKSWWQIHEPGTFVKFFFDEYLDRVDGSPYEHDLSQTCWADQNHNRIELWESEKGIVEFLYAQIDARYQYADFLTTIVRFAGMSNCLLFFEDEESFGEASVPDIYAAINRSRAAQLAKEGIGRLMSH